MSITLRPSQARGHADHDWLDTRHTFSFADYYDLEHMGFRDLRVINEDIIKAESGFPTHAHKDMEIITYVVRGALTHKDSTGGEGVLRRGDVQTMSAGTGVRHSEFNASPDEDARLLQIWILPQADNLPPAYAQRQFPDEQKQNVLRRIVSPESGNGELTINQDVSLYASVLDQGKTVAHRLAQGRSAWLQMVDGVIDLNGTIMQSGDGAAIADVTDLRITAQKNSEFLLFDLA